MKKNIPLVSILINNYNKENYCVKAVNSILQQSYKNTEIIFYDDFSSDNSLFKIKKIRSKKIKIVENRLRGKIRGFNQMEGIFNSLKKSKGEIICILDSDDFFEKNKIQKVVNCFNNNKKIDILFDRPIIYRSSENKYKSHVKYKFRKSKWPVFPPTSCISVRSHSLKKNKNNIFIKKYNEVWFDFRVATYYSLNKNQFNILDDHLTYYRDDPSSHDKRYKKFFNSLWWERRYQAFQFLNHINKKYYFRNFLSFDYLITKIVYKFTRLFFVIKS